MSAPAKLYVLHDGHASIVLQNAFHEALEMIEANAGTSEEQFVGVEGHALPIAEVIATMLECTDLVPRRTRDVMDILASRIGSSKSDTGVGSYADCARIAQELL